MSDVQEIYRSLKKLEGINHNLSLVLGRLKHQEASDAILRELIEELSAYLTIFEEDLFKLNRAVLLILSGKTSREETRELRQNIISDRVGDLQRKEQSLKNQLRYWNGNLNILNERDAQAGGKPPLEVTTGIIEAKEKITSLQAKIGEARSEIEYLRNL